ncbi:MAG: RNA 2',3'-cyclic phosphodiesterase [Bryobacteraceae bacterium]|nr:RNA 2',3'-cyclic phosphodiesterase [Bryobacteraceae bacterium]
MRLFTGIGLPADLTARLEALLERFRPLAPLKWSSPENLHVTTKFIGEWPAERLEELSAALRALPPRAPFEIEVRGLGWFPNPHHPRVFWAGVHAPGLDELARDTEEALARLGIPKESRPFSAHLTLARVKEPAPLAVLRREVAALDSDDFGAFVADRFYLYQSQLTPSGSIYTKLVEFPFGNP